MNMKVLRKLLPVTLVLGLVLVACGGGNNHDHNHNHENNNLAEVAQTDEATGEITVSDAHGQVTVPVKPERVVSLDNRTFQTLDEWGVELVAAPVGLIPGHISYSSGEGIEDVGNHREPNLEAIAAVNPDLVIVGQRFASFYDDIVELVPDAAVIDLNIDVSEEVENPGENLVDGFRNSTQVLGQIFGKEAEAEALIEEFDQAIEGVKEAYNGEDTIMAVVVSGGEIGYSAPGHGRVWGPLFEIFDWESSLEVDDSSSDHKGDDISVEAIAQSNPDWLLVLDRDAGASPDEETVPAKDVIEGAPALQGTTAITAGNVYYAPDDAYTNESIQTFLTIFKDIQEAFSK